MRLFVAAFFSDAMLDWLMKSSSVLAELFPARVLRLTKPENLHLTFQFLGEIQASKVEQISQGIEVALSGVNAFVYRPGFIGEFPNKFRPRSLWIGLEPASSFQVVAHKIKCGLEKIVPTSAKHFLPHITLARYNELHTALSAVDPATVKLPLFEVTEINRIIDFVSLCKSDLTQGGPIYSELSRFDLKKYVKL